MYSTSMSPLLVHKEMLRLLMLVPKVQVATVLPPTMSRTCSVPVVPRALSVMGSSVPAGYWLPPPPPSPPEVPALQTVALTYPVLFPPYASVSKMAAGDQSLPRLSPTLAHAL